jgi:flagellar basal body rod protein FlgF
MKSKAKFIRSNQDTIDRLKLVTKKGQSYDQKINELLDLEKELDDLQKEANRKD